MEITLQNLGANTGQLKIRFSPEDYTSDFQKELKRKASKMQIKGFRQGKAPVNMVRKLYGQGILFEVINQRLNQEIEDYIKSNEIDVIGQLISSEDQELYDFNPANAEDYTFLYDLGWYPNTEIKGADQEDTYRMYDPIISDEDLEAELANLQNRMARPQEVDEPLEASDMIEIDAVEKDASDPYTCNFKVRLENIAIPELVEELIGKQVGYSFDFDIYALEGGEEKMTKKYLLKLPEDSELNPGPVFKGSIKAILKNKPAELSEEFFQNVFGEDTRDIESAREKLRDILFNEHEALSISVFNYEIKKSLEEKNKAELDSHFVERLLDSMQKDEKEEERGDLEKYKEAFIWLKIRDRLLERFDVQVTEQDLDMHFAQQIFQYFGGNEYAYSVMDDMIKRMRSNQKLVNEAAHQILDSKIFEKIRSAVTIEKEPISAKALKDLVESIRAEA